VLQNESVFGEGILDQSAFYSLKYIQQISHDILLLHLILGELRVSVSSLRLCALEPIELNFVQILYLLLLRRLQKGVATSRAWLHFVHFFHFLIPLDFHLSLFLRFDVSLGVSSASEISELV
jgi:hypothetical protein